MTDLAQITKNSSAFKKREQSIQKNTSFPESQALSFGKLKSCKY